MNMEKAYTGSSIEKILNEAIEVLNRTKEFDIDILRYEAYVNEGVDGTYEICISKVGALIWNITVKELYSDYEYMDIYKYKEEVDGDYSFEYNHTEC